MAISCKRSALEQTLDHLHDAGMDALSVDLMEMAVSRTLSELVQSTDITGVLHIGWDESVLVIQNEGAIVYQRRVVEGLAGIHKRLCEQFALEDAAARYLIERMQMGELGDHERPARMVWQALIRSLAENLDVAIGYVSHAYRMAELGAVYLSGYGASNQDLHNEIDQRIGMPVHTLSAPTLLSAGVSAEECARYAIPYGLAARFDQP
jgi:Tfp pilus assembly PilM family ATPase